MARLVYISSLGKVHECMREDPGEAGGGVGAGALGGADRGNPQESAGPGILDGFS